ncbi:17.6 kDa class II heat shock protein [Citrus sinensis]|nr:17.6 kDa class II heat shock protein [Citrus sinensis]
MDIAELRNMGIDQSIINHLHEILDFTDEAEPDRSHHAPSRAFVREKRAMAATPADIKEYPNSYVFEVDVPGLKSDQLKVHVGEDNVLAVSGERKREKDKDVVRYTKMERRLGKYLKKFVLPDNADTDNITAVSQDGVLTITVHKKPPPEHMKPKTIQVHASNYATHEVNSKFKEKRDESKNVLKIGSGYGTTVVGTDRKIVRCRSSPCQSCRRKAFGKLPIEAVKSRGTAASIRRDFSGFR